MDIKDKIKEIDNRVTDLKAQIFNLTALRKKLEKQKSDLEKLSGKVDEVLSAE